MERLSRKEKENLFNKLFCEWIDQDSRLIIPSQTRPIFHYQLLFVDGKDYQTYEEWRKEKTWWGYKETLGKFSLTKNYNKKVKGFSNINLAFQSWLKHEKDCGNSDYLREKFSL